MNIEKKIEKSMFWTFSGSAAVLAVIVGIGLSLQEETRIGGIIIIIGSVGYLGYRICHMYK